MKKYDQSVLMEISEEFGTFNMLIVSGVSERLFFKEWFNQVFQGV